ncbi:hypothetical protein [Companilactobacillus jidongensis]|nr:hypothetical protein [Companilactobacillus jidongensis]
MTLSMEQIKNHQMTPEEFKSNYFYRTDLQKICRGLDLITVEPKMI